MEFRVLGPIELWSAGSQQGLGPARERCTLAILLLTPRTIVPAETLIDRLWDTRPPAKARESLSAYVARLRASLRHAVGDGVQLAGRAHGYMIDVDAEAVDLHQFRRLRREADALAASGDHDQAATLLREADGLWRGQALAGIDGDWVTRMRDSLEEERRAALLERVECELALGRHGDLVGELHHLLAQYALDETFIAHQMTALYRSGRPGDALGLYRETRSRLVEEQGTEPGLMLSELQQRILRRDPGLAGEPAARPPARVSRPDVLPARVLHPDTLPPETADFVGRDTELSLLIGEQGDAPRVSVIVGMPGVGKTALAVHAARMLAGQFPDGVFYLNFHSHDPGSPSLDAAEALRLLLQMLTVPTTQIPESLSERAALWRAQLSRRRAVVILDDTVSLDQIGPLLPAGGRSLILVTSRYGIPDLADARALTLDVLPVDDAIALFRRIADGGRAYDEAEVAAVVELCGHLPLAIQLTAGRLARDYPPRLGDLAAELSRPPARVASDDVGALDWVPAFELSYRALQPGHQKFFRRLGLSPATQISVHAAAALGGGTLAEAQDAIGALLDHHLLSPAPGGQFVFHDLIRGYAAMCAARDDSASVRRQAIGRLLDYYLHTTDEADRELYPFRRRMPVAVTRQPAAVPRLATHEDAAAWLEAEWRNVLQAAQYAARHEWKRKCADLIHALAGFVQVRAHWEEAIAAHTMALQASRDIADPGRIAQAALELSEVSQETGRHEAMLPLAEDAAAIYRSQGDRRGEAHALDQMGMAHARVTRYREALAYFHEARHLYRAAEDRHGEATTLAHAGIVCWHLGRYPDALDDLREAQSVYREVGDRRGEAKTLNNIGRMRLLSGYHRDALDAYQSSLKIFTEIGGRQNEAILYLNIGGVYDYKGSYEEALAAYRRALGIFREIGDLPNQAYVLNDTGTVYRKAECYDEALIHYEQARLIAEDIGNQSQQVIALRGIADVCRASGRYSEALDQYHAVLKLAREIGDPYEEAKILEGIAETTLCNRRPDAARILFRQALDIFERLGVPEAEAARIRIETMDPAMGRLTS
ncbi:MAG TPA: tetratricopeptide repeat protein [Streptosporangiaceae bacterium]|nr:tetratricopeptide repeat protein [Streptosporangiaceae bacterium]